jgi:uncharacterized protein (UPF0276 family)
MTEPEFLSRLCARGGCGLLLDVHNVYANAAPTTASTRPRSSTR